MTPSSTELQPQFFVTRDSGKMVPLVAIDELPDHVSIRSVSKSLTAFDISGMTGLGVVPSRHRRYIVDGLQNGAPTQPAFGTCVTASSPQKSSVNPAKLDASGDQTSEHRKANSQLPYNTDTATDGQANITSNVVKKTVKNIYPGPSKAYGINEQAPAALQSQLPKSVSSSHADRNAGPSHQPGPLPEWKKTAILPPGPAPGVKEYCSYWLRKGECDYAQQGCLYLHEMPTDLPTLESVGLRDIPGWYRRKYGLGSWLAQNGSDSSTKSQRTSKQSDMGQSWRGAGGTGRASYKTGVGRTRTNARDTPEPTSNVQPVTANGVRFPPLSTGSNLRHTGEINASDTSRPTSSNLHEHLRAQQVKTSIAALDSLEASNRDRDVLAEKYTCLKPTKKSFAEAVVTTDSSSKAASGTPPSSATSPDASHNSNFDGTTSLPSSNSSTSSACADHGSMPASETDELESLLQTECDAELDSYVDPHAAPTNNTVIIGGQNMEMLKRKHTSPHGYANTGGRSGHGQGYGHLGKKKGRRAGGRVHCGGHGSGGTMK